MTEPTSSLLDRANERVREAYGPTWRLERKSSSPGRGIYLCNWGVRVAWICYGMSHLRARLDNLLYREVRWQMQSKYNWWRLNRLITRGRR